MRITAHKFETAVLSWTTVTIGLALTGCTMINEPSQTASLGQPVPAPPPGLAIGALLPAQPDAVVAASTLGPLTVLALSPAASGRYLPGLFSEAGGISVGQGQAGYFAFDITQLADRVVCDLTLRFRQVGSTNTHFFPITISVYDVSTAFDRLHMTRIPIDAEGNAIATDLHSGGVYATFSVPATGEGSTHDVAFNALAVGDLQAAIDNGDQYFSIGLANPDFNRIGYFTPANASLIVSVDCVTPVSIDIKPGSDPNSINCNDDGANIPVAILTTDDFDATTVDHTSVTFEGAGELHVDKKTAVARRHEEDVDGDGDIDLVFHFRFGDTGMNCGTELGTLSGATFDGQAIEGTDAVRMVGNGTL